MSDEKTVATTLSVPHVGAMPGAAGGDQFTWLVGAAASVVASLLWLRRRTSRDSTEIAKDRAEANLIVTLTAERDRAMAEAREAWARRTNDAEEIARLRAANEYLERDVERLAQQVSDLSQKLAMVTAALAQLRPELQFQLPANPPAPG